MKKMPGNNAFLSTFRISGAIWFSVSFLCR